ncbi:MAG: GntR family transcriptional regulator [Lachnospiraceae bacterium]|nr:GntR family transcriptional regulator [Lachnospiraceae bacterium]
MTKSKLGEITNMLRNNILDGTYIYGTCIPSERELSEIYQINRAAIRSAIEILVNEGSLKKVQGKGNYVMKYNIDESNVKFRGMSNLLRMAGYEPSSRIVATDIRRAGFKLSKIFHLDEDATLFRIMRLRLGNELPISIENTYVPFDLIPSIEKIDFQIYSLYDLFAINHIHIKDIKQKFSTSKTRNIESKLLNTEDGSPVVTIQIVSSTETEQVVEATEVLVLPDLCKFYTDGVIQDGTMKIHAQE